jgi:glutathione S-transferase
MSPQFILYLAPGSSSMAVHIALHELGVPFERRLISFAKKEQREPAFLAINSEGTVPVLLIDGRPLTEVAAILFYLAKRFPEAELLPRDNLEAEAQALSWMSFVASTVHHARARGMEYTKAVFGLANRRLGARAWALDKYSIADIHLFRLFWRFRNAMQPAPADFPNLAAHHDRMMSRPAVRQTIAIESAFGYELPVYDRSSSRAPERQSPA